MSLRRQYKNCFHSTYSTLCRSASLFRYVQYVRIWRWAGITWTFSSCITENVFIVGLWAGWDTFSACLSTGRPKGDRGGALDGCHSRAWWQEPRTRRALITSSRSHGGAAVHVETLKRYKDGWKDGGLQKNQVHKSALSITAAANRPISQRSWKHSSFNHH